MTNDELRARFAEVREQEIKNADYKFKIVDKCICCGTFGELAFVKREGNKLWVYFKCPNCGFIWLQDQIVSKELYESIQSCESELLWLEILESQKEDDVRKYNEIIDFIFPYLGVKPINLLDIGCSSGIFLETYFTRPFESKLVMGIELNHNAAEKALGRNLVIYEGTVESYLATEPEEKFNVITLLETLEHLADPKAIIQQCHELLEPDGLLFIFVPNGSSLLLTLEGDKCGMLGKDHLWLWNPHTLFCFIDELGFSQVHSKQFDDVYYWNPDKHKSELRNIFGSSLYPDPLMDIECMLQQYPYKFGMLFRKDDKSVL